MGIGLDLGLGLGLRLCLGLTLALAWGLALGLCACFGLRAGLRGTFGLSLFVFELSPSVVLGYGFWTGIGPWLSRWFEPWRLVRGLLGVGSGPGFGFA